MEEFVGAVFGNVSTTEFRFAVRDPGLKRMDYVEVEHPTDGALVAQIAEITRETNLSFDEVSRRGYHPGGAQTRDHLVARSRVIGFRDATGRLQAPRTPVPAGAEVRRVQPELLAHVFGLRDTEGAYFGVVKGYDLRVVLDINTLVQKHVSVLAKTGSGKSYAVGVLMEEIIKSGVPIVIIDPHGEHSSLAQPNNSPKDQAARRRFDVTPRNYGEHIVEYSPDTRSNPDAAPFTLESRNLDARDIAELLGGKLNNSQMGILHAAVRELREKGEEYDLVAVLETVREAASNSKWNLVSALENLTGLDVFAGQGMTMESLVVPRKVSILNLKGVSPEVQQLVVGMTARRLFEARKVGKVPPFMLVVEEAHNFCPERGMSTGYCGEIMRTLASEGRKFGMGLTVVSQRPAKVDKNVLSQCNTQVILKVTNPNDLRALASSVEGFTSDSEDEIQRLPVGVAFVSHPRISIPVLVEVRPRETAHGGESIDVLGSLQEPPPTVRNRGAQEDEAENEEGDDEEAPAEPKKPPNEDAPAPPARAPTPPPPLPPPAPRLRAPRPVVVQEAASSRVHASAPAPAWIEELEAELRLVANADVMMLTRAQLVRLEEDLSQRAQALAQALHDVGPRGDALLSQVNAELVRVHERLRVPEAAPGLWARVRTRLRAGEEESA